MVPVAILLVLCLAAIVQAQDQCVAVAGSIPLCAVSALGSAAAGVGCGPTDFSCQCIASKSMAINTAALSGVLKACGPATGLAVEASASAVCACAASATPAEATTTSLTPSTSSTPAVIASSAAPATTPAPTTSTTASATVTSSSAGTGSGSTTSSSAAQITGAAVKAVASIGECLGAFIAIMAVL